MFNVIDACSRGSFSRVVADILKLHQLDCIALVQSSCFPFPSLLIFHCLSVSVMGAWMPSMGTHGWVVWIAHHGSGSWSRGWLAFSGSPWTSQAPNLHIAMQLSTTHCRKYTTINYLSIHLAMGYINFPVNPFIIYLHVSVN